MDAGFYAPAASPIRFTEGSAAASGASVSYWLLLTFLFLLYANLPFILPATEILRPAKLVAGAALVMLLVETMRGQRTLNFVWPEGSLLAGFVGAAALSCLTALWPRQAAESLSDLVKMALVFFFIANCANTERRLRGVMWTVVVGGLIPAAGTLRNYLQGNLVEGRTAWLGIFANPNEVAYSLIILLPLAACLATGLGLLPRLALLGHCAHLHWRHLRDLLAGRTRGVGCGCRTLRLAEAKSLAQGSLGHGRSGRPGAGRQVLDAR